MKLATLLACTLSLVAVSSASSGAQDEEVVAAEVPSRFSLEGKVFPPDVRPRDWYWTAKVVVEGGWKIGYIKEDNTFVVHGLPSGSYLVEVVHPNYSYEPVRVDINSKGKIRARRVNNIQPNQVNTVNYPLKMKTLGKHRFFQKREEWKITDMLVNPMVLMMVVPLALITVIPKIMNDPDTKREMEQMQQSINVQNQVPELSELMSNLFSGGQPQKTKKIKSARR